MKGIAHFASGIAAASCFPWTVPAALEGNPAYFILGALFGLLPDTLDFKFYRYFYRHDRCIAHAANGPDPQAVADGVAAAIEEALRHEGPLRLKVESFRPSADLWRRFTIRFDPQRQGVAVELGPLVTTGQVPVPGTHPADGSAAAGWCPLAAPIRTTYQEATTVDIFDGPSFGFERDGEGRVVVHFLPWHRSWTHSLVVAAGLAFLVALPGGWRAGAVAFAAHAVHVLEDQLGFMGSNLFAPLSRRRSKGLGWMRSGDALPNFATVWFCGLLVFWNCYRAVEEPILAFGFFGLLFYGGAVPFLAYGLLDLFARRLDARTVAVPAVQGAALRRYCSGLRSIVLRKQRAK